MVRLAEEGWQVEDSYNRATLCACACVCARACVNVVCVCAGKHHTPLSDKQHFSIVSRTSLSGQQDDSPMQARAISATVSHIFLLTVGLGSCCTARRRFALHGSSTDGSTCSSSSDDCPHSRRSRTAAIVLACTVHSGMVFQGKGKAVEERGNSLQGLTAEGRLTEE